VKSIACIAAVTACLAVETASAETVWQLASAYSDSTFHTANLRQFAADVALATGGKLTIEVRSNGTLAPMAQIESKVESGSIAAGEVISGALAQRIPIADVDSVPFIVSSYDDARRLWKAERPVLDAQLAAHGLIALYAVAWPPQGLYSTKPLHRLGELQGSRMRTYNAATQRIAQKLGATPVDVPSTDLGRAISAGQIDSMLTSTTTGADVRAWEHMKYFYDVRAWYPKNIVLVNAAALNALEPSVKSAVMAAAVAAEDRGWKQSVAAAGASLSALATGGMHIDPVDYVFHNELGQQGERFSVEYVRAIGAPANSVLIPYFAGNH